MERIREGRRMTMAATPNGLSRRRQQQQHHHHHHRTINLRNSPENDGAVELQETGRLRDRGNGKRDRDADRDRERERERERDRDSVRDRLNRSKRRDDRIMPGSNRGDDGDGSSEESGYDDEDDEDEDGGGGGGAAGGSVRMLPPHPVFSSTSSLLNHRKSLPQPTKVLRPASTFKAADEMIGVSVPRKARSASKKRSHDCWASSGGIVGEQIHRQSSTSPGRTSGASAMGIAASQSPASPSSNASARKKIKPSNAVKLRPPKSCSNSSSSAQDEIEIEIAEVLYGMMKQSQGPTKQEIAANESMKSDCREANNKSSCDAKSRVSSPISISQSVVPLSSAVLPQNSGSSITALKRKRPRPVKNDEESPSMFTACSPISSTAKAESENLPSKIETSTPENGSVSHDAFNSQASEPHPEPVKLESAGVPESKSPAMESESRDSGVSKDKPKSPKTDSHAKKKSDDNREVKVTKANPTMFEAESHREDKFQIDLMAPPPPQRSSPERDGDIGFVALEPKPVAADMEMVHEIKPLEKEDEKGVEVGNKFQAVAGESEKARIAGEETRNIDLQLDLDRTEKDNSGTGSIGSKKRNQNSQRLQQPNPEKNGMLVYPKNDSITCKSLSPGFIIPPSFPAVSNSLPLQMCIPSWSGLPTMGYMAPLQGVVSMDGSTISSAVIPAPQLFFGQPRPKRCATHCYIARNISYHQQIARMNPFWPAPAGSNSSVISSTDRHSIIPGRNASFAQEKGPGFAMFPDHFGKEKGLQAANVVESAERKQILLQQSPPPGAPSNILHGPAFIFSLNQQQAAAAASVCTGTLKSSCNAGSVSSSSTSNTDPVTASATGPATAAAMSFSYPSIPGNEAQYLAMLKNNAYPFPVPAHVGAPPAYRETHPQALPFFNGSFYSSQIIHPSQPQQQLPAESHHSHQGRQSTSFSGRSTSSQKHLQNNQQQKSTAGGGNLQSFPPKNQALQQQQHRQRLQTHHIPYRAPQMELDTGNEDNPATDCRLSRGAMSLYGQNFAMPMQQPANFATMTSTISGMNTSSTSGSEKKQQQQSVLKAGVETSQAFAIPFAPINGPSATPAIDLSSIPQNHPIVQSHGYQMMAAAAVAQQKKRCHVSEEEKTVNGDSSNGEDERKAMGGKIPASIRQSIAFSRSDITNLGSASGMPSSSVVHAAGNPIYAPTSQQQLPINHQQQQILQLHKNQQFVAAARSKFSTSNGSVYTDHLPSTFSVTTFPTTASPFHQNLEQNVNPTPSSHCKYSGRAPTSPSLPSAIPQIQGRSQQSHMQSPPEPVVQPLSSNQSPSPPIMVGSPTTSSMSKSAGGSPRTTSSSTSNKFSQASSLSSQQVKNSQSVPSSKSSPVGGRNVPSILGSPHLTATLNTGTKSQVPQLQQQPHISKQALQQAQFFFSNTYLHTQTSQSSKRNDAPKNGRTE